MMQKHIDGILLPKYQQLGFTVRESTDAAVHIMWHGIIQASFTQYTTAQQLNDECESILNREQAMTDEPLKPYRIGGKLFVDCPGCQASVLVLPKVGVVICLVCQKEILVEKYINNGGIQN